jgi:putative redox protein
MGFTATARRVGRTLRHEVDVNGRHTIVTDEPEDLGGTDTGPAPHELLPATLAACIGTMVSLYAQRREWDLGEVEVHVDYDHGVTPRSVEVTLGLSGDLSAEQIERLGRVAETCPFRRALEAGFRFEERIVHTHREAPGGTGRARSRPGSVVPTEGTSIGHH